MSNQALGREMRLAEPPPEVLAMWTGVSVFATENQAMAKHRRFPSLGRYVVELEVDDQIVRIQQTGRDRGHFTIWGSPREIATGVRYVKSLSNPAVEAESIEHGA